LHSGASESPRVLLQKDNSDFVPNKARFCRYFSEGDLLHFWDKG